MECIRWECVAGYRDWGVGGWSGLDRCFLFDFLDAGGWELLFGGVAMRFFFPGVIPSSDRPNTLLPSWAIPGAFLLFRPPSYASFLGISPSLIKKEKHRRWNRCITYRVGGLLSASPACDKQPLVIISLYLTYGKTWNLFIRLIS